MALVTEWFVHDSNREPNGFSFVLSDFWTDIHPVAYNKLQNIYYYYYFHIFIIFFF